MESILFTVKSATESSLDTAAVFVFVQEGQISVGWFGWMLVPRPFKPSAEPKPNF